MHKNVDVLVGDGCCGIDGNLKRKQHGGLFGHGKGEVKEGQGWE